MKYVCNLLKYIFVAFIFLFLCFQITKAQDCDPTNSECLKQQIDEYQKQIGVLQGQANTLSNQIAQFNAQVRLAELKIESTQEQIDLLAGRIKEVQGSLTDLNKSFSARAVETYKMARSGDVTYLLLSSKNLGDAFQKFHYLEEAQSADQSLLTRLKNAQDSYVNSKKQSEDLQKQLQDQQNVLTAQKAQKQILLDQTKGSEANYQKLLAQARAQLAQLAGYAESVGVNLIPHQDISDSFGKYYNQRDSNWGGININGSGYSVSAVGCLLTSFAMVSTHFGSSITPAKVAADNSNFWPGTALMNKPGPSANGHSAQDVDNPYQQNNQVLKDALNSGAVVIAGLSKDGGPYPSHYSDHWVVLRSVDGDSFKINDPLYAGAMNVSLGDHYTGWTILQAKIYR